jgi:hypothetical protein
VIAIEVDDEADASVEHSAWCRLRVGEIEDPQV